MRKRKKIPCACKCGEWIWDFDNRGRKRKFVNGSHTLRLCRNKFPVGSKHPDWKGGKVMDHYGYILVWNDDPRFQRNNGHYVKEHILVMEKHLGRRLELGEVVHHKNGIKTDNRLENLEVFRTNGLHMRRRHNRRRIRVIDRGFISLSNNSDQSSDLR